MRLINYGTGEIVDRLTILSLKELYGAQASRDITHFRNERNVLLTQLHARDAYARWYEHGLALHAVNAALWQAEDELRWYRTEFGPIEDRTLAGDLEPVVVCAFRIQALNDRRAELIAAINASVGDPSGQEKIT